MKNLKTLRRNAGISQKEFAEKLDFAQNTVSQWETGKRDADTETLQRVADFFKVSVDVLLGRGEGGEAGGGVKIPVLGKVQAGIPIDAIQEILDYEEISSDMAGHGEYFALQIRGRSMEPEMREGDVVIIRRQPEVESGEIAIVLVNGNDATVKKVTKQSRGITLVPFNRDFDPIFYSAEDIETKPVRILGKVVELRKKY